MQIPSWVPIIGQPSHQDKIKAEVQKKRQGNIDTINSDYKTRQAEAEKKLSQLKKDREAAIKRENEQTAKDTKFKVDSLDTIEMVRARNAKSSQEAKTKVLNGSEYGNAFVTKGEAVKLDGVSESFNVPFTGNVTLKKGKSGNMHTFTSNDGKSTVNVGRRNHPVYGPVNTVVKTVNGQKVTTSYIASDKFGTEFKGKDVKTLNGNGSLD